MNELGITDSLTSDHHFEQAGFRVPAEGLRTRVSWHAAQDQPKWAHEWEYMSAHPQKREEQPIWQLSR